jgi:hypothetical protein
LASPRTRKRSDAAAIAESEPDARRPASYIEESMNESKASKALRSALRRRDPFNLGDNSGSSWVWTRLYHDLGAVWRVKARLEPFHPPNR